MIDTLSPTLTSDSSAESSAIDTTGESEVAVISAVPGAAAVPGATLVAQAVILTADGRNTAWPRVSFPVGWVIPSCLLELLQRVDRLGTEVIPPCSRPKRRGGGIAQPHQASIQLPHVPAGHPGRERAPGRDIAVEQYHRQPVDLVQRPPLPRHLAHRRTAWSASPTPGSPRCRTRRLPASRSPASGTPASAASRSPSMSVRPTGPARPRRGSAFPYAGHGERRRSGSHDHDHHQHRRPAPATTASATVTHSDGGTFGCRPRVHDLPHQEPHSVIAALSCGEWGSMPAEMSCPMLPSQLSGRLGNACLCMQATNANCWRCCCACSAGVPAAWTPWRRR